MRYDTHHTLFTERYDSRIVHNHCFNLRDMIYCIIAAIFLALYGAVMIWATAYDTGLTAIIVAIGLLVFAYAGFNEPSSFTPEYELEIINQDSVRIRSLSTGRVYTERYDQIQNALIKDNL